jgi:hypothetical protein
MANRVPDPREMLKVAREVRRTTTRFDIVQVCEELERRLLLDLKVDPPDAVVVLTPPDPVVTEAREVLKAASKAVARPAVSKPRANAANPANAANKKPATDPRRLHARAYAQGPQGWASPTPPPAFHCPLAAGSRPAGPDRALAALTLPGQTARLAMYLRTKRVEIVPKSSAR